MTNVTPAPDIFTRINDASEKVRLLMDLATARGEIIAKRPDPSAEIIVLMAVKYHHDKLACKLLGTTSPLTTSGDLILTFFIGGEKYFFQTEYSIQDNQILISTMHPLYHLQRREDYRIRIPTSYKALFEIVSINGQTQKKSLPMMDLSGGGCRLQIDLKSLPIKLHDELKGHLFFPDRTPISIVGSVRHLKSENHKKDNVICGVQFVGLTEPLKNRIIAVVMDLYREFFSGRV